MTEDFQDGMNEIGAILESISDGFDVAQPKSQNHNPSEPLSGMLSQLLISKLMPTEPHATETEEWPIREENNFTEKPE